MATDSTASPLMSPSVLLRSPSSRLARGMRSALQHDHSVVKINDDRARPKRHHRVRDCLRRYRVSIVACFILLAGVAAMGVFYHPPPVLLVGKSASAARVQRWAMDASACAGGGVVTRMRVNRTTAGTDGSRHPDDGQDAISYTCVFPTLTWKSYVTTGIVMVALMCMINNLPPDATMLTATVALLVVGIIDQKEAWGGFSTPGVMAVGVLFVVAQGLQEVGVVDRLLRAVLGAPSSLFVAQVRLMLPVAVISAFMNNTPVVAMMIPIVDAWSQRIGMSKSKFLIPLSFSSMLGGMCTLIGTSTNLILAALVEREDPTQAIGMFDMAPVGAPLLLLGVLYMAIMSRWLLPDTAPDSFDSKARKIYQTSFAVPAGSAIIGRTLKETGLAGLKGVAMMGFQRGGNDLPVADGIVLQAGDKLIVEGVPEALASMRRERGLHVDSYQVVKLGSKRRRRLLVEVVLSSSSPLIGRAVEDCSDIMTTYDAAVVAVRKSGHAMEPKNRRRLFSSTVSRTRRYGSAGDALDSEASSLGSPPSSAARKAHLRVRLLSGTTEEPEPGAAQHAHLAAGDALVLEVYRSFLELHTHSTHFALVREVADSKPPRFDTTMDKFRAGLATLALIGMVIVAALGYTSLLTAALIAALLMIIAQVLTLEEAFRSIRARVIIAIVTTFGLGIALQNTGVAGFLAQLLVSVSVPLGPFFLLYAIFLVSCIVGSVVSNNANVILMFPICVKASFLVEGVPLKQFCIVLMMASSMSFMTPIGYQTNLMVLSPGGYNFTDFPKFGVLMQLVLGACAVVLTRLLIE